MTFTCGACGGVFDRIQFHCLGCDQHNPVQHEYCVYCGLRPRFSRGRRGKAVAA